MTSQPTEPNALKSLYRDKKELFGLVYEFNMLPAGYIHRTWIESIIPYPLFQKLINSKRGLEKLSRLILERNQLIDEFHYDFLDPSLRLALLPRKVIEKLILYCGIALNHVNITAAIGRIKQKEIIECIGRKGYLFAAKEAPLLVGNREILKGAWPAQLDVGGFIESCGAAYLLSSLAHAPRPLFIRLMLKLPKHVSQKQQLVQLKQKANQRWLLLRRILMHAIEPQWYPLFS
jgi:hypothetical protein